MRIIAGKFRGRALATPSDDRVRPTSDRVREALFNILAHGVEDFAIEGSLVLDLFAGTGALSLEALSRGAKFSLLVETEADSRGLIRENVEVLGQTGTTKIYRRDATDLGPAGNREPFTLVFADPPYGKGLGERALNSAAAGGWIAKGALVVLEERAGTSIDWPTGFQVLVTRTWGDTQVMFARFNGVAANAGLSR